MGPNSTVPTSGNDPRRERVKHIFFAVCDLDPLCQRERLQELCGSNLALQREVEQLLDNDIEQSLFDTKIPTPKDEWIGRTLQNYKILERIGEGGMGFVYRGEDVRLKRQVAVKFLATRLLGDSSQRERFLREAQAAASLRHPSICTVYDIGDAGGQPYIVTAYLEGDTLEAAIQREKSSFRRVIEYAIQLAEGLQAAHARGIIHRDLKPSNVILSRGDGEETRATIIDFGLAQVSWADRLTRPGLLIGTANYICPELLQGQPVAEQADIWSLGVMLYEMLAGRPPFDADNRERLFHLICHESPVPLTSVSPELPHEIGRIVARALEKDAELRYQTMSNLLSDLRALKREHPTPDVIPEEGTQLTPAHANGSSAPTHASTGKSRLPRSLRDRRVLAAAGAILLVAVSWFGWKRIPPERIAADSPRRIAVLPFEDLSIGERNERLSRTLGESLAVQLAGLSNVRMVSTSGVRKLLERGTAEHEIISALDLDFFVTGFVERSGQTLRTTANLISGRDSTILYSKKLDLPLSDILAMQNQFADTAAREMGVKLGMRAADSAMAAVPADAYDLLLKARYSLLQYRNQMQPEFLETAEKRLRRAIELNPQYSDTLAEMADLLMWKLYPPRGNRQELLNEAGSWLNRALLEDPKHPRANRLMSNLYLERRDPAHALEYARRAVHESPEDTDALHQLDRSYGALGFFESALVENEKSVATDAVTLFPSYWHTWYLIQLGRFSEAKESIVKLRAFDGQGVGASTAEALLELHKGNYKRAAELYEVTKRPGFAYEVHSEMGVALAGAASGNVALGRSILQKYVGAGTRLTDLIILLAATSGEVEIMAKLTRESQSFASYGWLARNTRFFKSIAGRKAFQDLLFDLHRKWEADLIEIGPTLPVRPPELPKPEALLASLRRADVR